MVLIDYFTVGLGLSQVIGRISAFKVAGTIFSWALAGFAFVVALSSFRDALLAAKRGFGQPGDNPDRKWCPRGNFAFEIGGWAA